MNRTHTLFRDRKAQFTFLSNLGGLGAGCPIADLNYKIIHAQPIPPEGEQAKLGNETPKGMQKKEGKTDAHGRTEIIQALLDEASSIKDSAFLVYVQKKDKSYKHLATYHFIMSGAIPIVVSKSSKEAKILGEETLQFPQPEQKTFVAKIVSLEYHTEMVCSLPKKSGGNQPVVVQDKGSVTETTQQNTKGGTVKAIVAKGCLCGRDITEEEFKTIFPTALKADRDATLKAFNTIKDRFEINTCVRMNHFFAQVLQETGGNLNLEKFSENMNYSTTALLSGSPFSIFAKDDKHKKLAELYGRGKNPDGSPRKANPEQIANIAYAKAGGNQDYKGTGAGWKFRGRGFLQITGYNNYNAVTNTIKKVGYTEYDFVEDPDKVIKTHLGAVISAAAYWKMRGINAKADKIPEKEKKTHTSYHDAVNRVTFLINPGENPGKLNNSKKKESSHAATRRKNFEKIFPIFVGACQNIEK